MWRSCSSVCCLKHTVWVPSKWFFISLAVAEVCCLVTETCEGMPCCCTAFFGSGSHSPCRGRVPDLVTRLTEIVLVRSCSGLCNFETEILTSTAMVVDLVVCLVVVGHWVVWRVYNFDPTDLLMSCINSSLSFSTLMRFWLGVWILVVCLKFDLLLLSSDRDLSL